MARRIGGLVAAAALGASLTVATPLAASAALFDGRPWGVAPHDGADPAAAERCEVRVRRWTRGWSYIVAPEAFVVAEHDVTR